MKSEDYTYYKVNSDGSLTEIPFKEFGMIFTFLSNYFDVKEYRCFTPNGELWQNHYYLQVNAIVDEEKEKEEKFAEVFILMEEKNVKEKTNE